MAEHAFDTYPTMHWEDGKFFYAYTDGRLVPTVRPHGWISESSEKRVLSEIRRKGYTFDGSPQFWAGGIGYSAWLIPSGVAVDSLPNDAWHFVSGDTLAELLASIKRLPKV